MRSRIPTLSVLISSLSSLSIAVTPSTHSTAFSAKSEPRSTVGNPSLVARQPTPREQRFLAMRGYRFTDTPLLKGLILDFAFLVIVTLCTFWPLSPLCQETWSYAYGGYERDSLCDILATNEGGYIAAGYTESFGAGQRDGWVLRLDELGGIIWQKTYGGADTDLFCHLFPAPGGDYYLAGTTRSFGLEHNNIWILRIDPEGNILWETAFGHSLGMLYTDALPTDDGGIVLCGETDREGSTCRVGYVVKLTAQGVLEWQTTYGWIYGDSIPECITYGPQAIVQTKQRDFVLCGLTFIPWVTETYWLVTRLGSDGTILWNRSYDCDLGYRGGGYAILETAGGGFLVSGANEPSPPDGYALILNLDSQGNLLWSKAFGDGSVGWDISDSIAIADDRYLFFGDKNTYDMGRLWTFELDQAGQMIWQRLYGVGGNIYSGNGEIGSDGGLIIPTYSYDYGVGDRDGWVIKTNHEGNMDTSCDFVQGAYAFEFDHTITIEDFPTADGPVLWQSTTSAQVNDGAGIATLVCPKPCALNCEASATPATGTAPLDVMFASYLDSQYCSGEPDYEWSFGDGNSSDDINVSHTYPVPGTYDWALTVEQDGARCSRTGTIHVFQPIPGDCDGDRTVTIGEVQKAINMFLAVTDPACRVDADADGFVSIGEVQGVINGFLGVAKG